MVLFFDTSTWIQVISFGEDTSDRVKRLYLCHFIDGMLVFYDRTIKMAKQQVAICANVLVDGQVFPSFDKGVSKCFVRLPEFSQATHICQIKTIAQIYHSTNYKRFFDGR